MKENIANQEIILYNQSNPLLSDSFSDKKCPWGKVLLNGALLLEQQKDVVLCKWKHNEYATWKIDPNGHTYDGHYISSLKFAVKDFNYRIKQSDY